MTDTSGRPVYVLGAGFSAAISDAMPLTNDIGAEIKARLGPQTDVSDLDDFEDWLSVRVAAMPFLSGHENQQRLADAQHAISVIAQVIDLRSALATEQAVPLWLAQLLAIWHAEHALVVTFNYDCLVERAVNDMLLTSISRDGVEVSLADEIAYPSPTPPPAVTWSDQEGSRRDSFQLLKVHGSVNWYWNAGDQTGSSLSRSRERSGFGGRVVGDPDYSGTTLLDRFLIPPVATKSDYYLPPLTKILWRIAGEALRDAGRLTLIGYSMPTTDRATTAMLKLLPRSAELEVVDRFGDSASPGRDSVVGRAGKLIDDAPRSWTGTSCAQDYVEARLQSLVAALRTSVVNGTILGDEASVTASFAFRTTVFVGAAWFALATRDGRFVLVEIDESGSRVNGSSVREAALNGHADGAYELSDFMTTRVLREHLAAQPALVLEHAGQRWIAIAAEELSIEDSPVLHLHFALMG
jgi:hypothetical protein